MLMEVVDCALPEVAVRLMGLGKDGCAASQVGFAVVALESSVLEVLVCLRRVN